MHFQNRFLLSVSTAALLVGSPVLAADVDFAGAFAPAVSGVNGKIETFMGSAGGVFVPGLAGALSLPVGERFGAQIDGLLAASNDAGAYGVGGHFFWRDPARGLLGLYGGYVYRGFGTAIEINGIDVMGEDTGKVGFEGEAYMSNVSFEGFAGYQFGTNSGFAGKATVALYPNPDFRLDLSVRHIAGPGVIGSVGLEWQPSDSSVSLFADAGAGPNVGGYGLFGIKLYSGAGQKSLIQRHREDDPSIELPHDLFGIIGDGVCPPGVDLYDGSICDGAI